MTLLPAAAALAASARATSSKVTLEASSLPRPRRSLRPARQARRRFTSSPLPRSQAKNASQPQQQGPSLSEQIRSLMRESAQPVALVTSFLPPTSTPTRLIHGATLSSFSSISIDPNLVCFSMKTPSKLASSLQHHHSTRQQGGAGEVDFVVNILSETQAGLAAKYAVPGTPPLAHPPAIEEKDEREGQVHPLQDAGLVEIKQGAVPVAKDSIGAFACQVVDTVDLSRYASGVEGGGESRSMLYIARVLHVYTDNTSAAGKDKRPLIYHQQGFVSTTT
ncbi:hypothetical protein NDA14_004490 [Ustilago hordei]|uniref:Flavin reductase like domain-containing protein n=1 Tax=Ustilago hordei TaxID=120017 RepID=I2FPZ9_USTHO|nr:uncharacterized protein UHO2_06347 [Ustilago hordei]KAJ1038431.1 hypothetical protein NDA10_005738 [Ustilago hordei]KAJ1570362.1 hypothetical protein NDA15_003250 [Ustilago hordei]KAJ1571818.1 hypothetical protein NDA12_004319 [Ustilago hordei]KAJ1604189.1 hypothetical protein NDA14_004490 [Ustilago hordei]UTT87882.1 hypothetical protein NDA17_007730 [Ustilago hordei]